VDFDSSVCFLSEQAVVRTPLPPPNLILAVSDSSSFLVLGAPGLVSLWLSAHYFHPSFAWSVQPRPDFPVCRL
jgi:hypothetical protein